MPNFDTLAYILGGLKYGQICNNNFWTATRDKITKMICRGCNGSAQSEVEFGYEHSIRPRKEENHDGVGQSLERLNAN